MKRHAISLTLALAVFLSLTPPLHAQDDFSIAVHRIADRVGKSPLHIPFLGVLLFFTPARGAHLKVATFEDVHTVLSLADLENSMHGVLSGEWHPFVKVDSRRDHECTLIYARINGSEMRLMVITAESGEVTVVQMDVP